MDPGVEAVRQPETQPAGAGGEDEPAGDDRVEQQVAAPKKKKRSRTKRSGPTALNKIRGTGFEDGFADPPMTPAEYEEERLIYDPESPFVDRIEECIQRYRGRRRLDNTRDALFSRYLNVGGIDTTQRQFTGASGIAKDDLAGMTRAERRLAAANDVIGRRGDDPRWYTPGDEGWSVDFAAVAACYLSVHLPIDVGGDPKLMQQGVATVLNFLNYVVRHDVCPEHDADLARARAVCKRAAIELPMLPAAVRAGVGQFSDACAALFAVGPRDGRWLGAAQQQQWQDEEEDAWRRMRPAVVFAASLVLLADLLPPGVDAVDLRALVAADPDLGQLRRLEVVVEARAHAWEVVGLCEPAADAAHAFRALLDRDGVAGRCRVAGVLVARPCIVEDGFANTPKLQRGEEEKKGEKEEFFIVDRELLRALVPGMKLRLETAAVVLNGFRLVFIRSLLNVQPSFHTYLPQLLMLDFKQPRENPRDPPSVHDAEENGDGGCVADEVGDD